jgi:uncharacterized protein (TIGR03118 family)
MSRNRIIGPRSREITTWNINYLVDNSNNRSLNLDILLEAPWGIVIFTNQLWVVDNSTDRILNFDLFGNRLLGDIFLRDGIHQSSFPTGIAINCNGGFPVSNVLDGTRSSLFLTATELGGIHGYNPDVGVRFAGIVINNRLSGIVHDYKGIALTNGLLYLPDFFRGRVDVYNSEYERLEGYHFLDGDTSDPIPIDYRPYNIVAIGRFIYILWARRDPNVPFSEFHGAGHGFISVFNPDGSFVGRFTSRGVLNSPWAMIPAPCECGIPPGSFLVGNHGDGRINIFDPCGKFVGPLLNQRAEPIVIVGLRGLAPHYADFNQIFFTASPDGRRNTDGVLGSLIRSQVIRAPF